MADQRNQTLENHTRFDPLYHYFLTPLSAIIFVAAVWHAIRNPDFITMWMALSSLLLLVAAFLIRTYSLKVQNRVIRLEERLRLSALVPDSQRSRIGNLTEGQLIALRFASDAELPALAARALDERLAPADIKKAIRTWRADDYRV